jgi:hypothetical protein
VAYPQSPAEWRDYLIKLHLDNLRGRLVLAAYYDGTFAGPVLEGRYAQAYRDIWSCARSNWGRLIVDVAVDRLSVEGMRLDSSEADDLAWDLWQRSHLDALQSQVYVDGLVFGLAGTSGLPLAAIKLWADTTAHMVRADVFLPDAVYRWVIPNIDAISDVGRMTGQWQVMDEVANPYAPDLPLVPFENRLRLGVIQGDLDDLIPAIDRLTRLQADMMLVSSCLGFPQRWATGIEIPRDSAGNPIAPFKAAADRLWMSEGDGTKFGSFQQADMTGILKAIDVTVAELAARSRTPAHLLMQSELVNPPSAQALQVMESGLVSRVNAKQRFFGEAWERVMSLMLRTLNDPRANLYTSEVIWKDPETHSESVRADALVKLSSIGVPNETLWQMWGFSPPQIERMREQAMDQALTDALAVPPSGGPPAPPALPPAAPPAPVAPPAAA